MGVVIRHLHNQDSGYSNVYKENRDPRVGKNKRKNDLVSCHNAKFIRPAHMVEWTFERPHNNRTEVTMKRKCSCPFSHHFQNRFSLQQQRPAASLRIQHTHIFEFWKINYFAFGYSSTTTIARDSSNDTFHAFWSFAAATFSSCPQSLFFKKIFSSVWCANNILTANTTAKTRNFQKFESLPTL